MNSKTVILHPYSSAREEEQTETWKALELLRTKFEVIDKLLSNPDSYDDFILEYWGKASLVIVEQDIVPSLEQVCELTDCPGIWCCFKYQVRYLEEKNQPYWITTGFGLTKLDVRIQQVAVPSSWHKKGDWTSLDSRITGEFIRAGFNQHIHGEVKHNRVVSPWAC
jgi:hypothetical protein